MMAMETYPRDYARRRAFAVHGEVRAVALDLFEFFDVKTSVDWDAPTRDLVLGLRECERRAGGYADVVAVHLDRAWRAAEASEVRLLLTALHDVERELEKGR